MKIGNPWNKLPELKHLAGMQREHLERRKRLKQIRYLCFTIQTALGLGKHLNDIFVPISGFKDFWLDQEPEYMINPKGQGVPIPEFVSGKHMVNKKIHELGGYAEFAKKWDIDHDLRVYLRHSSIWQEWNATLMRVVPVLGEGE